MFPIYKGLRGDSSEPPEVPSGANIASRNEQQNMKISKFLINYLFHKCRSTKIPQINLDGMFLKTVFFIYLIKINDKSDAVGFF